MKMWTLIDTNVQPGAKSEKVEQELEGKLPPFSLFFLLFFCVFYLFCVWEERKDSALPSFSYVAL